ncbi:MAG: amino acid permease [Anaerolineaceae bacterium]|nr:amino acid permease [Anaerolineaceae bacterium]
MSENSFNNGSEKVTLSRNLSMFSITMIGVGGMIGAGIFVLTGTAANVAGPAVILTFLLNGIVTLFTALAYAELGSAFPEAGGGYLWVKEGLGGTNGFLAGWMSWFAHAVAGSLYALAFGRFMTEFIVMLGLPTFGLTIHQLSLIFMVLIVILFTYINFQGVSETGSIGNIITVTKIVILLLFVLFGVAAMLGTPNWEMRFTTDFMPNGIMGVFTAMGLTFVAFEGYEIISQSGEEAIDPKRNIPRAIFWAIGIAVAIYILVGITAIGAVNPPAGQPAYLYLGEQKEIAVIEVAGQTFPWGIGRIVLLISGIVSTMSALNATTYSSSRVSFAMGRDHNLPSFFSFIDGKNHTPIWAIVSSSILMIIMGLALPIDDVAAAADIMFLLLFLQVNVTLMTLRKKMPELDRGFRVPWVPFIPVLAIVLNAGLAIFLFTFSAVGWYFVIGWLVIGIISYLGHFSKIEAMEKPKEILHEEVLVSRQYSVVVPVVNQQQATIMGKIGAYMARGYEGEVIALHVLRVPPQLSISEGRLLLKEGRPYLDTVIKQAKQIEVPVHTIIRLGRKVSESIRRTVVENASDLLLLGWPGYTESKGTYFGSVIDPIIDNPPCDVAVVRYRQERELKRILIPIGGGINSRLAVKLAVKMTSTMSPDALPYIELLHVTRPRVTESDHIRAQQVMHQACEGTVYVSVDETVLESENVEQAILDYAAGKMDNEAADLIVIGASEESIFKNLLVGNIVADIIEKAEVSVMMVKRRSSRLRSLLRETVLQTVIPEHKAE